LEIPSIGVTSDLLALGLTSDGHLQVPWKPLQAGWYKYGVTPGEIGPAIIAGHVDSSATGPAVFYDLAKLTPGAIVVVKRKDGSTVRFAVQRIGVYPKDHFPTGAVYSPTTDAQLRLITCSGWDASIHHYVDNTVVYLSMIA
jgi:sortase (surface protein transpeptidase)